MRIDVIASCVLSLIAVAIAMLTYTRGKSKDDKKDGSMLASIQVNTTHIWDDVKEIKTEVKQLGLDTVNLRMDVVALKGTVGMHETRIETLEKAGTK